MNSDEYAACNISDYWDRRHQEWAASPNLDTFAEKDRWFDQRFAHVLPIPRGRHPTGQVLDYGCGCGMYSVPLLRRFEYYIGVDTSAAAIEIAEQNFSCFERTTFTLMKPNTIHTKVLSGVCACVVSITVLQHQPVERRLLMIEEIKRVLKPGGLYVGLEMLNGQAPDMPRMDEAEWVAAWRPMIIARDVVEAYPEWVMDNIWIGRMPDV